MSSGCVEDDALLIFAHEKGATTSRLGRHCGFISEKKNSVVVSCDETTAASLCSIIKRQELILKALLFEKKKTLPSFLPVDIWSTVCAQH